MVFSKGECDKSVNVTCRYSTCHKSTAGVGRVIGA